MLTSLHLPGRAGDDMASVDALRMFLGTCVPAFQCLCLMRATKTTAYVARKAPERGVGAV